MKFVNKKENYYPCIVAVSKSKWGVYAKLNGSNHSEKSMIALGYTLAELSQEEEDKIIKAQIRRRNRQAKLNHERYMSSLTPCTLTLEDGKPITCLSDFIDNSENTGQITQGSDAFEAVLLINNERLQCRKHWSNNNIGVWRIKPVNDESMNNVHIDDYVGCICFENGKTYLQKSN